MNSDSTELQELIDEVWENPLSHEGFDISEMWEAVWEECDVEEILCKLSYGDTSAFSVFFNFGVDRFNAGNFQKADSAFGKAHELEPKNAHVYYYMGRRMGELRGAIINFEKALEINPNYLNAKRQCIDASRTLIEDAHDGVPYEEWAEQWVNADASCI